MTSITNAILLIAHGSRHERANADLRELADRMTASGRHEIVEASFLELAEPDVPTGGRRCVERGAGRILMIPYFLSAGVHLLRDLSALRNELERTYPHIAFILGPPLGPHPLLDELVEAKVEEAARGEGSVDVSAEEAARTYSRFDAWESRVGAAESGSGGGRAGRLDEKSEKT